MAVVGVVQCDVLCRAGFAVIPVVCPGVEHRVGGQEAVTGTKLEENRTKQRRESRMRNGLPDGYPVVLMSRQMFGDALSRLCRERIQMLRISY